jgi:hypothetical protein
MPDESVEASARTSDCVLALVNVTRAQVHELLRRGGLDFLDRPHFEEGREGLGQLLVLLTFAQVEDLRAEGYEVQALSNQSARWRERRAQLGRRDPFEGSPIPRGIGRKIGGRQPGQRPPRASRSDQEPEIGP